MGKKRIYVRVLAGLLAFILSFTSLIAAEPPVISYASQLPDDVVIIDEPEGVIDDIGSQSGIIGDENITDNADDTTDDDQPEDISGNGESDASVDPQMPDDVENADETGSDTTTGVDTDKNTDTDIDIDEPELSEDDKITDFAELSIDLYPIHDDNELLSGIFALTGDDEYDWDYAGSADKVIVKQNEEDPALLDVYTACGYSYELPILINDAEFDVPKWLSLDLRGLDETDREEILNENRADYLNAVKFIDGDPYTVFTIDLSEEDQEIIKEDNNLSVGVRLRPVTEEESFLGIFRWSTDPSDADEDFYIGDASFAVINVTMPEDTDGGATYDLTNVSASDLPDYVSFIEDTDGTECNTLIMPKGSSLTVKLLPSHGHQVEEVEIDDKDVTYPDDETIGLYEFTVSKTIFNLSPVMNEYADVVVTDDTDDVISGEIIIESPADETEGSFHGSARLEVSDVPQNGEGALSNEQIENFKQAATEASEVSEMGGEGEIISYLDISLYSVVNKAKGQDAEDESVDDSLQSDDDSLESDDDKTQEAWECEIKEPEVPVKVTLNLDPSLKSDSSAIQVIHQKEITDENGIRYEYEVVPSEYDPENNTLTFEAESFSVYALSLPSSYSVYISAVVNGVEKGYDATTINEAVAFITDKNKFNSFRGEYILNLGKQTGIQLSDNVTIPKCVTKLTISPYHESDGTDPTRSTIDLNGYIFKSEAPVLIDGFVSVTSGRFIVPSLELGKLAVLCTEGMDVSGETLLHGGSYLICTGSFNNFNKVKVFRDYELNGYGEIDEDNPLNHPAMIRTRSADLKIKGAITADSVRAGLRFGVLLDKFDIETDVVKEDYTYYYTGTQESAYRMVYSKFYQYTSDVFSTEQSTVPGFISVINPAVANWKKTSVSGGSGMVYAAEPVIQLGTYDWDDNVSDYMFYQIASYPESRLDIAEKEIAALNNPDTTFKVRVLTTDQFKDSLNIVMPKSAKKIEYSGEVTDEYGNPVPGIIRYPSSFKLTCDLTLKDLSMRGDNKKDHEYIHELSAYTLTSFDLAGHRLDIEGEKVTFNTPVDFKDSSKNGTFRIDQGTRLITCATDSLQEGWQSAPNNIVYYAARKSDDSYYLKDAAYDERADFNINDPSIKASILAGSITNVGNVIIPEYTVLIMTDYQSKENNWVSPKLTTPRLDNYGQLWMDTDGGDQHTSQATITNAFMYGQIGNELKADSLNITYLSLMDEAWVESRGQFNVSGLFCYSEDATLATVQNPDDKKASNTPFLNVTGDVILEEPKDRINVCVKKTGTMELPKLEKKTEDKSYPSGSMVLLNTKNGTEDQFVPYHKINSSGNGNSNIPLQCYKNGSTYYTDVKDAAFNGSNANGYFLKKTGNTIYMYPGDSVKVAVIALDGGGYFVAGSGKTALENNAGEKIDYYPSWADAVAGVNARKEKRQYLFIIVQDIGKNDDPDNKPIDLTFPGNTNIDGLIVTGNKENCETRLLYTKMSALTSDTKFTNISIAPVAYYKKGASVKYPAKDRSVKAIPVASDGYASASVPINAGAYELQLYNVKQAIVSEKLDISSGNKNHIYLTDFYPETVYVPWIGNVSGNGQKEFTLSTQTDVYGDYPVINGSVTKFSQVTCYDDLSVAGDVNVSSLFTAGTLSVYGKNVKADFVSAGVINAPGTAFAVGNSGLYINKANTTSETGSITSSRLYVPAGHVLNVYGKTTVKTAVLDQMSDLNYCSDVKITDTLVMNGKNRLSPKNTPTTTVTVNNIECNNADNMIRYVPNNRKMPGLTITGTVTGNAKLAINYYTDKMVDDFLPTSVEIPATDKSVSGKKLTFPAAGSFADVGLSPSEKFVLYRNDSPINTSEYMSVKYNKNLYLIKNDTEKPASIVKLKRTDAGMDFESNYADMAEATAEINAIGDNTAEYEMTLLATKPYAVVLYDTVITDSDPYGKIVLPAKNKMKSLIIQSQTAGKRIQLYTCAPVTGYGEITFKDIVLKGVSGGKNETDKPHNMTFETVILDNSAFSLADTKIGKMDVINNSGIDFNGNATISALTVNKPNSAVRFKKAASINELKAIEAGLDFSGKAVITSLNLYKSKAWFDSDAQLTNLYTDNPAHSESVGFGYKPRSVIFAATKTLNGPSLLNIKGNTSGSVYIKLRVPVERIVYGKKQTVLLNLEQALDDGDTAMGYEGRQLALAPVANASEFYAYGLFVDPSTDKCISNPAYVSYKDAAGYVINDNINHMLIKIENAEDGNIVSYAHTWNEAVSIIDKINSPVTAYSIYFLKPGRWRANAVVNNAAITDPKTQVAGSYEQLDDSADGSIAGFTTKDVAAITMPKATAARKINIYAAYDPDPNNNVTSLVFKGELPVRTDIYVENVYLTNAKLVNLMGRKVYYPGDFETSSKLVAVTIADGKTLEYSNTLSNGFTPEFTTVKGAKGELDLTGTKQKITGVANIGKLTLETNSKVNITGKLTATSVALGNTATLNGSGDTNIADLVMDKSSVLDMEKSTAKLSIGKLTIKNQSSDSEKCRIKAPLNTTVIGNMAAVSGAPNLDIYYYFTTPTATKAGTTTLTFNGAVDGVKINLIPKLRDFIESSQTYASETDGSPKYHLVTGNEVNKLLNVSSTFYHAYEGKMTVGDRTTWNKSQGWYDRMLVKTGKAGITGLDLHNKGGAGLFKSGQGIYITTDTPSITVTGYSDSTMYDETYRGEFFDYSEAVAEADRIGSKTAGEANSFVKILLKSGIGTLSNPEALKLPSKVCRVDLVGEYYNTIFYTTTTNITAATNVTFNKVTIIPRAKNETVVANINMGKNNLVLKDVYSVEGLTSLFKDITCADLTIQGIDFFIDGKVNASGDVVLYNELMADTLTAGSLVVNDSEADIQKTLTANNIRLNGTSTVAAADITVKEVTRLGSNSTLKAGKAYVGDALKTTAYKAKDGKITLKDVVIEGPGAVISVKKAPIDAKGISSGSQLTITGSVECMTAIGNLENKDEPIQIEVRENTTGGDKNHYTSVCTPEAGMVLVNAPLASDRYFRPSATMMDELYSTHYLTLNGKIFKKGNAVVFDTDNIAVRLHSFDTVLTATGPKAKTAVDTDLNGIIDKDDGSRTSHGYYTEFTSYEDAVSQIEKMNRYKMLDDDGDNIGDRVSQYYEDYDIEFVDHSQTEYDIKNAKGDYTAIVLPAKAGEVRLYATHGYPLYIKFTGGVTLKSNLIVEDGVVLVPVRYNQKTSAYEETFTPVDLRSFRLRLKNNKAVYDDNNYFPVMPSAVTGGNNSKIEIITVNNGYVNLYCPTNIKVASLDIDLGGYGSNARVLCDGNMTADKVRFSSPSTSCAEIRVVGNTVYKDISINGNIDAHLYTEENKPIKINGEITNTASKKIYIHMDNTMTPGTVIAIGEKVDLDTIAFLDDFGTERKFIRRGNNLVLGWN